MILRAGVLVNQRVGITLGLRDGEEQTVDVDIGLAYGFEELNGIVAAIDTNHVKPAMALESELNAALVDDSFAHVLL